jgi:hypothetical protein
MVLALLPANKIQVLLLHQKTAVPVPTHPQSLQGLIPIIDTAGPWLPRRHVSNFHFTHILRKIDDFLLFYYT